MLREDGSTWCGTMRQIAAGNVAVLASTSRAMCGAYARQCRLILTKLPKKDLKAELAHDGDGSGWRAGEEARSLFEH